MEENQCRICLLENNKCTVSISDPLNKSIVLKCINELAKVEIACPGDGLPQFICINCFTQLQNSISLRELILESDRQLRKNTLFNVLELEEEIHEKTEDGIKREPVFSDTDDEEEKRQKGRSRSRKKKWFSCCRCKEKFTSEEERADHFRNTHINESFRDLSVKYFKNQKYECQFCFRKFSRKAFLNKHFEDKSFVEPKVEYKSVSKLSASNKSDPKICPTCGKVFSDKYQLALHESRVHATEKPFKCKMVGCSMAFALERLLKRHFKNVHEEKRMICDFCSKLFRTMKDLRQHMYVHMETKPLQCSLCSKTFTLARVLKAHMLASHSGIEKPFQCDQCEKAYKWKEDLRAHRMVEHLGIYPFKCRFCGKGYSGSSNRNWHEKRCPSNNQVNVPLPNNLPQAQQQPLPSIVPPHSASAMVSYPPPGVIQFNQF